MTGLILVGLIPFAGLGIFFGHMLTPDSIGPVMGGSPPCSRSSADVVSRSRTRRC